MPEEWRRDVVDGGPASAALPRRVGLALRLHAADVFVPAGQEVPEELAPEDPWPGNPVPGLVRHAVELSPDGLRALRGFVAGPATEARGSACGGSPNLLARGGEQVTAGLPADVAAALGIPAPDLAVLTGAAACEVVRRTTGTGLGELIADGRRLTSDQRRTVDLAGAPRD
ncbi:hypothetical protein [Streptomyces sp. NPDC001307]|uniref:hypothetical protein n=1 Tax=Streptomyces sp. NPDC001307 TaxID=3364560 RepID=UPI0036A2EA4B